MYLLHAFFRTSRLRKWGSYYFVQPSVGLGYPFVGFKLYVHCK